MKYRYDTPPRNPSFDIFKIVISTLLLALCFYFFTFADCGIGIGILALALFCFFMHGVSELLGRNKELPFCEIDEETIYWREEVNGTTYKIEGKEIDLVIAAQGMFNIGIKDENELFSLSSYGDYPEVLRLLKKIAPEAKFKQWRMED